MDKNKMKDELKEITFKGSGLAIYKGKPILFVDGVYKTSDECEIEFLEFMKFEKVNNNKPKTTNEWLKPDISEKKRGRPKKKRKG